MLQLQTKPFILFIFIISDCSLPINNFSIIITSSDCEVIFFCHMHQNIKRSAHFFHDLASAYFEVVANNTSKSCKFLKQFNLDWPFLTLFAFPFTTKKITQFPYFKKKYDLGLASWKNFLASVYYSLKSQSFSIIMKNILKKCRPSVDMNRSNRIFCLVLFEHRHASWYRVAWMVTHCHFTPDRPLG